MNMKTLAALPLMLSLGLGLFANHATAATTTAALSDDYHLQSLQVSSDNPNTPSYTFKQEEEDSESAYTLTTELTYHASCQAPNAAAYRFVLKIVNTFRVVVCLTPHNDGNDNSSLYYDLQLLTRVSSTRILPPHAAERQLEKYWKRTLVQMDHLEMSSDDDGDDNVLALTNSAANDDEMEIVFLKAVVS